MNQNLIDPKTKPNFSQPHEERVKLYARLCALIGSPQPLPYALLCDQISWEIFNEIAISLDKLIHYLAFTKGINIPRNESIRDLLVKYFGNESAQIVELLL